jgi:hypothetical protein
MSIAITLALLSTLALSADVPYDRQAKLMLKIISIDRNFARFGDPVKIGVSSDGFFKVIKGMEKMKIKDKNFVAEKMSSLDDIAKYKVIYVGKNWASDYTAAGKKATGNQCLAFCEEEAGVLTGGFAISFKVVKTSPKIVVNLDNVKKQGTDFPANFLKVTVVVGAIK